MKALEERWETARHLLAMRLDNIGDVIMTGPALQAIKEQMPGVSLTLLVNPGARGAAAMLPWVDQVLVWRSLWQDMGDLPFEPEREIGLIQTLHALRFDAAVIFTSFSQSPHAAAYACYLAGIPLRLAEPKSFGGGVLSHMPPTPTPLEAHQIDRNLRLLEAIGLEPGHRSLAVHIPQADVAAAANLRADRLPAGAPYVVLSPWTSCQARTYPQFGQAARLLHQATGLPILITGAERDRPRVAALLEEIGPGAIDLVGQTSVPELAALIAEARLLLTNNTSTMHLADALRTPQVVLFAGTELEEQWAPRSGPARLLRRPTLCQPCFQFTCRRGLACLAIEPEQVVAAAVEMLESASPQSQEGVQSAGGARAASAECAEGALATATARSDSRGGSHAARCTAAVDPAGGRGASPW